VSENASQWIRVGLPAPGICTHNMDRSHLSCRRNCVRCDARSTDQHSSRTDMGSLPDGTLANGVVAWKSKQYLGSGCSISDVVIRLPALQSQEDN
jgi:hypothetical protein